MTVLALDLGGTKLAGSIVEPCGKMVHHCQTLLGTRQNSEVGDLILAMIRELLLQAHAQNRPISAVGICVPGIYFPEKGEVWAPNIPGWERFPLRDFLHHFLDGHSLPIHIGSDREACILGEAWLGAARGCRNAVFLVVGTGIGAGILLEGRVLQGIGGAAGAVGWMALHRPYREEYAGCGCLEYYASGMGIAQRAVESFSQDGAMGAIWGAITPERIAFPQVFEAYRGGNLSAVRIIHQAIEMWGMTVANLVSLLNPERILFGGGLFGPAAEFLDRIHAEAARWAQPQSMKQVKLVLAELGGMAPLYGAARIALNEWDGSSE